MLWLGLSMEQGKWESVCGVYVCVCVGGVLMCVDVMQWGDEKEPLQVENFIQFKHSISFIDPLQRGGNERREDKEIRWIHLNML